MLASARRIKEPVGISNLEWGCCKTMNSRNRLCISVKNLHELLRLGKQLTEIPRGLDSRGLV